MKKLFRLLVSIAFPWIVLLIHDDPLRAFFAIIMQITIVGWIPASVWAWKSYKEIDQQNAPKPSERRDVQ